MGNLGIGGNVWLYCLVLNIKFYSDEIFLIFGLFLSNKFEFNYYSVTDLI